MALNIEIFKNKDESENIAEEEALNNMVVEPVNQVEESPVFYPVAIDNSVKKSDTTIKNEKVNLALLKSANEERDLLEVKDEVNADYNLDDTINKNVNTSHENNVNSISKAINNVPYDSLDTAELFLNEATKMAGSTDPKKSTSLINNTINELTLRAEVDVDETIKQIKLNKEKLSLFLTDEFESIPWYTKVGEFANELLPTVDLKDRQQIIGVLGEVLGVKNFDVFENGDIVLNKTVDKIFSLPVDDQYDAMKTLYDNLLNITSKERAVGIMQSFVNKANIKEQTSGYNILGGATASIDAIGTVAGLAVDAVSFTAKALSKKSIAGLTKEESEDLIGLAMDNARYNNDKNIIKDLHETGNTTDAVNLNLKAIDDNLSANTLDIEQHTAVDNFSPIPHTQDNLGTGSNMVIAGQKKLAEVNAANVEQRVLDAKSKAEKVLNNNFVEKLNKEVDEQFINNDTKITKVGTFGINELNSFVNKPAVELSGYISKSFENVIPESVKIKTISTDKVELEFNVLEPALNSQKTFTETYTFKLDELGEMDLGTQYQGVISSPMFRANFNYNVDGELISFSAKERTAKYQMAEEANQVTNTIAKARSFLIGAYDEAIKPIKTLGKTSSKSMEKLNNILIKGDQEEVVYNIDTLKYKHKLKDNEIEAYYNLRAIDDNIAKINNEIQRDDLLQAGKRWIEHNDKNGKNLIDTTGKVFDSKESISKIKKEDVNSFYDAELEKIIKFDDTFNSEDLLKKGKIIVKLDDEVKFGDDLFDFVIVEKTKNKDIPNWVIPVKTGHIPRVYDSKAERFFVKSEFKKNVNGKEKIVEEATRRFSTIKEANEYARRANKALEDYLHKGLSIPESLLKKNGKYLLDESDFVKDLNGNYPSKFVQRADREPLPANVYNKGSTPRNKLSNSARSNREIKHGLPEKETQADRKDVGAALLHSISNTAGKFSRNSWRKSKEQLIINAANKNFDINFKDYEQVRSFLRDKQGKNEIAKRLKSQMDNIDFWNNIKSSDEISWASAHDKIYSFLYDKLGKNVADKVSSKIERSPVDILKAINYNMYLGLFQTSQLFIQSMSATIALSITKVSDLPTVLSKSTFLLTQMLNKKTGNLYLDTLITKNSRKEYEALARNFNDSGLKDAILENSDYEMLAKGHGSASKTIEYLADKGQIFFKSAEAMNRAISYTAASEKYASNFGKKISDFNIADKLAVVSDAEYLMLNMNRAQKSYLQKGSITSLVTQFKHVLPRSIELTASNRLTGRERANIAIGQFALFGTAGVNIFEQLNNYLYHNTEFESEEEKALAFKTVNDGLISTAILLSTGLDIDITSRASLGNGIVSFIDDTFDENASFWKMIGGPTFNTISSYKREAEEIYYQTLKPISNGKDLEVKDYLNALELIFAASTTKRSIEDAIQIFNNGNMRNSKGLRLIDDQDYGNAVVRLLGFRSTQERISYNASQVLAKEKETVKKVKDIIAPMIAQKIDLLNKDFEGNKEQVERINFAISLIIEEAPNNSKTELYKYHSDYFKKNGNGYAKLSKDNQKYIDSTQENFTEVVLKTINFNEKINK